MTNEEINEYKYLVQVSYSNHCPMYYNSGHYLLDANPNHGTRYKTIEAAQKDVDYASYQGGKGDVVLLEDALKEYSKLITI